MHVIVRMGVDLVLLSPIYRISSTCTRYFTFSAAGDSDVEKISKAKTPRPARRAGRAQKVGSLFLWPFSSKYIYFRDRVCVRYSFSATFLASVTGVGLEDTFRPEFGGERDSTRYKHVGRSRFVAGVGNRCRHLNQECIGRDWCSVTRVEADVVFCFRHQRNNRLAIIWYGELNRT